MPVHEPVEAVSLPVLVRVAVQTPLVEVPLVTLIVTVPVGVPEVPGDEPVEESVTVTE